MNDYKFNHFSKVTVETKKSYEKLATLRKEFGHSGSHKSDDGTLYIGNSLLLDCDGSHRSVYIGKQSSC